MAAKKDGRKSRVWLDLSTNVLVREKNDKLGKEVIDETSAVIDFKATQLQEETVISTTSLPVGDRLIRLKEVLQYIPVSKSHFYVGIKSGQYPTPVKHLGPRISAWRLSEILQLVCEKGTSHE